LDFINIFISILEENKNTSKENPKTLWPNNKANSSIYSAYSIKNTTVPSSEP
jgi:hypothetical protein